MRPLADLRVSAQRMDGRPEVGRPLERMVAGGPGPSIVNLPASGCRRLRPGWSGRPTPSTSRYG